MTASTGSRRRIGLTGGIASGKSSVSGILGELGAVVIDSDQLAREVVEPGTLGLAEIVEVFGRQVITETGHLDRPALGQLVFADDQRRRTLEGIIHPRVRARSQQIEQAAAPGIMVVHDIPLLVETGQEGSFDEVIVVDVPEETQIARMVGDRGWTREDAQSRIAAQATREQRLAAATMVIDNSGTLEELRTAVTRVYADLIAGALLEPPSSGSATGT